LPASAVSSAVGQKRKLTSDRLLSLIRPLYSETCRWGNSHNSAFAAAPYPANYVRNPSDYCRSTGVFTKRKSLSENHNQAAA